MVQPSKPQTLQDEVPVKVGTEPLPCEHVPPLLVLIRGQRKQHTGDPPGATREENT